MTETCLEENLVLVALVTLPSGLHETIEQRIEQPDYHL